MFLHIFEMLGTGRRIEKYISNIRFGLIQPVYTSFIGLQKTRMEPT